MSDTFRPIYTTFESVKVRLRKKVAFQDANKQITNDRVMPDDLLGQLIVDAETAVEQDLRGRYSIPFRSKRSGTWQDLPDHSRRAIRTIVDTKAVIMILADSFGSGTHITADGYMKQMVDQYDELLRRLLGQDMINNEFGERRFKRTPPLEDVVLSPTNVADDGLFGVVSDASPRRLYDRDPAFAEHQINDPSVGLYWFSGGRRGPR